MCPRLLSLTKHLSLLALAVCGPVPASHAAPIPTPKPVSPAASPARASTQIVVSSPRTHDPSTVLLCGKTYWMFSTGPGITSRQSADLKTWTEGPPVFREPPAWAEKEVPGNRGYFWAPEVIQHQGRYLLYYSISTFGKNHSVIALASNATLDPNDAKFAWKEEGIVIRSLKEDNYNAIDPAVIPTPDGRLWLSFGSFWSGLKLTELDPATGKLKNRADRLRQHADLDNLEAIAYAPELEAPALLFHEGRYYLFANHGLCCKGLDSTYRIVVGRSKKITGPYLDAQGGTMMSGGGTLLLGSEGRFHGPGHAGFLTQGKETLMGFHFYDRNSRGQPAFGLRRLTWSKDGWPVLE